jgi:tRNA1Val (adenine37-N6)-methyltransferase
MHAPFDRLHLANVEGGIPIDVQLLVDFVRTQRGDRVLDLGTGTGAIAIALATKALVFALGIDSNARALALAEKNLQCNQGLIKGEAQFRRLNVKDVIVAVKQRDFNVVVSNPPYYKRGSGRLSPRPHRAEARQEADATFADFARAAAWALKHHGRFDLIHTPSRMVETLATLRAYNLEPKRLLPVYPARKAEAELILIEAVKGAKPGLMLLTPLVLGIS